MKLLAPHLNTLHYYLILSCTLGGVTADTISNHLEFAKKLLNSGKYSDALPHFHQAISEDPDNYLAYFQRATLFLALNRPKSALDDLSKALELDSNFTSALVQRANLHLKLGNLDEAHIDFEKLRSIDTQSAEYESMLKKVADLKDRIKGVESLMGENQFDEALKSLNLIIEVVSHNVELLKMRAKAFEQVGEKILAIEDYLAIANLTNDTTTLKTNASKQFIHVSPLITTNYSTSKRRSKNYASFECAKVIESNPEAKKTSHIINEMTDEYMLNPCTSKIWFVIELCDSIQATQIEIANYELYSSTPRDFTVYFSDIYPTTEWKLIGHFTASDSRTLQAFDLNQVGFGKFIRVELQSHYGDEHYCVISEVKVYGVSMADEYESEKNLVDVNNQQDNLMLDKSNLQKTKFKRRKISAFRVYRNMMVEPRICGLMFDSLDVNVLLSNGINPSPSLNLLKDQPTQQPVVVNISKPLKPSIFVELSNKVKALEVSLKTQIESIERKLIEKTESEKRTEATVLRLNLRFDSFALLILAYHVYKLMLHYM